jgi:trk system potassium uptake protein TrkA
MKIVIIGLGTIGQTILKSIDRDSNTITVIDQDKEKIESLIERYDVFGVVGNGACRDIQNEAEVGSADLVIVLTRSDELNILACLVAKNIGAKNTIARVRNPEYRSQIMDMKDSLGISMIVNPEMDTAREIFNLISLPSIAQIERFAKGRALLVEIVAEKDNVIIGETLISLGKKLKTKVLICAVQRGSEVIIPSGNFSIQEGDRIYFTADANSLGAFLNEIDLVRSPLKKVMIVGGDKTGFYLADTLSSKGYKIKLIENDSARAEELAVLLPQVTVIVGNGTQHDLLLEEGIEAMDAFVALTDIDEENMIVSMFANKMKLRKTITQISGDNLYAMLGELGIKNNVSPTNIVANRILSYVRALDNKRGSNVLTLYRLVNNQVEALEFAVRTQSKILDKPLKELRVKKNCLIACIIRGETVIIPNGNSTIEVGDNVVAVTTHKNFDDLADIFE